MKISIRESDSTQTSHRLHMIEDDKKLCSGGELELIDMIKATGFWSGISIQIIFPRHMIYIDRNTGGVQNTWEFNKRRNLTSDVEFRRASLF